MNSARDGQGLTRFTEKNVTRNTYICAVHWPGEKGPTSENSEPLKANLTPAQLCHARPKEKGTGIKIRTFTRKAQPVEENCGEELNDCMAIGELEEYSTDSTTSIERNDSRDVPRVSKNPI